MTFKNFLFKVFLIIFLFCHLSLKSYSQTGTIAGTVVKKSDGTGLSRANVKIREIDNKEVLTNPKGKYLFSSVPSQKYTLIISKSFYEKKETITSVKDGETTEVPAIELVPSDIFLSIEGLPSILKKGNIEEYAKQIDLLMNDCKTDDSEDCGIVREIAELILKKNLVPLESKTIQLSFYAGAISEENYFFKFGTAQLTSKNYIGAIDSFTESIALEPTATFAYTNRGAAYVKIGKFNSAISDYNAALTLSSRDSDLFKLRADAYFQRRDFRSAIKDYTKASELNPNNCELYNLIGVSYDMIGDRAKADRKNANPLEIICK